MSDEKSKIIPLDTALPVDDERSIPDNPQSRENFASVRQVGRPRQPWKIKQLATSEQLLRHLENYDRTPFHHALARFIENGPSDEAIAEMADSRPDRWAQTLKHIAGLAGFVTDRHESHSITAVVDMSDSQLADALRAKLSQLGISDVALHQLTSGLSGSRDAHEPQCIDVTPVCPVEHSEDAALQQTEAPRDE